MTDHRWTATIGLMLATAVLAGAQPATTNADIIRMVKAKTPDAEIIALIESTQPRYNFTTLTALTEAGVSDEVFKAMAARTEGSSATSKSRPAAVPKESARSSLPAAVPKESTRFSNKTPTTVQDNRANDALTVTSLPVGATVEWNRKVIGTTPMTHQVGEYAFNVRKSTIFSKRLLQPVVLRISKEGYITKELTITTQYAWRSLNGKLSGTYFIITGNNFQIDLDKISAAHTAMTNIDVVKLKEAGFSDELIVDKIANNPAAFNLELNDLIDLRKVGVSDVVIQAMLHAK